MTDTPLSTLFASDVTRDIPPVVYFHEQAADKVAAELAEYIITGGHAAAPGNAQPADGIHEQYVRLLTAMADELERPGGPSLPTAWISGFYGSGKSSFAKLLGLALDGLALPNGLSAAEALLRRDTSPRAAEFRAAWDRLCALVEPMAVIFDIGGVARGDEQIHSAAVRQVQIRLGYCPKSPHVADFELRLELDDEYDRFEKVAAETLGKPWSDVRETEAAEEAFSQVMHALYPERYIDPMAWFLARAGTAIGKDAPEDAVKAIAAMMRQRRPGATLFLVIDEVSQYVIGKADRGDRLRAFASALGAHLKGRVWLLALGQQKLDESAGDDFLVWAKDRFPPKLRVHLAPTNIRDVVHKRLLHKKPAATETLRGLFAANRPSLKLYAYGCEEVTPDAFAEVYPMLPGQIDLLLEITTALRLRSTRAQGDDQAIRGLLQLLGELFRSQALADRPVGTLVTLDQIYAVQHTALESDTQTSMAKIIDACAGGTEEDALMLRAAKAVAMLELIQESRPTTAELVAQCLYDRVDRGNNLSAVTDALEALRTKNLVGYAPQNGYKIQSLAAEDWERERREIPVPRDVISSLVQDGLKKLLAMPERPRLEGRPFPWAGVFSDGRHAVDATLVDPRDDAAIRVDFRYLAVKERVASNWVNRSNESAFAERLIWICGDREHLEDVCRGLSRSQRMVDKYKPRRDSLTPARKLLLTQEENRVDDQLKDLSAALDETWMAGELHFRGRTIVPTERGQSVATVLHAIGTEILKDLFPHFDPIQFSPGELEQLLETDIPNGVSSKFLSDGLGVLELDSGQYVPSCSGLLPRRVLEYVEESDGVGGNELLAKFGRPPFGYSDSAIKACALGLLRGKKLAIQPEGKKRITNHRDADTREIFLKDREFKRATVVPGGADPVGPQTRAKIAKFFQKHLDVVVSRDDEVIADAVQSHFPAVRQRWRDVETRLRRLAHPVKLPNELERLTDVLEACLRNARRTEETVVQVKKHLDGLRDGVATLRRYESALTDAAVDAVNDAQKALTNELQQLRDADAVPPTLQAAADTLVEHLASHQPWVDVAVLAPHVADVRAAYRAERERLLRDQEAQVEAVRDPIKRRSGFSTLTAEQRHSVLRLLSDAQTDTTADAVAPTLAALRDPFAVRLHRAEEAANTRLDALLAERDTASVVTYRLSALRHREVASADDLNALLDEVRDAVAPLLAEGNRVRLT